MEGHWRQAKAKSFFFVFSGVYVEVHEQGGGLLPKVFRSRQKNLFRLMYLRGATLIAFVM